MDSQARPCELLIQAVRSYELSLLGFLSLTEFSLQAPVTSLILCCRQLRSSPEFFLQFWQLLFLELTPAAPSLPFLALALYSVYASNPYISIFNLKQ